MRRSSFRYKEIARELASFRKKPYNRPLTTRCAEKNYLTPDNEKMDIMRLASRNVQSNSLTKRPAFHFEEEKDNTSFIESKRVKIVQPNTHFLASSLASESSHEYQDNDLLDNDASSDTDQSTWKKDALSPTKGNHYALSKIVDYLQTRTLASYFKNPTKEDRMKSSGLANVTKSLMAASVVHLGGKYDRHADSYLRGLRLGLSYASDRHEMQQEEGGTSEGNKWSGKRGKLSADPTGVSRDLREVYYQKKKHGEKNQPRLNSSKCREKTGRRVFSMRQHKGDICCDDEGGDMRRGVQLCTLEELKQLEALGRLCRSRKRARPPHSRRRRSANSSYWKPKVAGKGRWWVEQEGSSNSRSRSRKRGSYQPKAASIVAGPSRTPKYKPKVKMPRKGGRSKHR